MKTELPKALKIIDREMTRLGLIILSPIFFPIWFILIGHESWESFWYYWRATFSRNLNLE